MESVELKLVANNSQAVQAVKELATESNKLYTNNEKNQKRQVGLIADIEKELGKLQAAQKNAMSLDAIEKYNKKIAEAKLSLEEYNKAGISVQKQGDSMMQSIGKWALGFASVATAVRLVKDAFESTEAGLRTFNVVGAVTKQIMYDLVTVGKVQFQNIAMSIKANKEAEKLRVKEREDLVEIAKQRRIYNELYFAASDMTKTDAERLQILDQALIAHGVLVDKQIDQAKEQLSVIEWAIMARPEETKLLDAQSAKLAEIQNLEGERFSSTKRLERQRTGIIKGSLDEEIKLRKDAAKEAEDGIKENHKNIRELYIKLWDDMVKDEKLNNSLKSDIQKLFGISDEDLGLQTNKSWIDNIMAGQKALKEERMQDAEDQANADRDLAEQKKQSLEKMGEATLKYLSILEVLSQKEVERAQRERQLLDTKVDEAQNSLNTELELYKNGYASNVAAKQKEVDNLKKQRDKALVEEEKARKKQHTIEVASLVAQKAVDVAKIISSTAVANAKAVALSPLTLGQPWVAINTVAAALGIAAATAAVIAASNAKYAKGGWTGEGNYRDSTGERMAGIVHEREFVVRRGPANKFRSVLEAINRDDKRMILNSFNRLSPELSGSTNNILVENTGPNRRLDEVNQNLRKMAAKEEIMIMGNLTIIKKGNSVRTIKR